MGELGVALGGAHLAKPRGDRRDRLRGVGPTAVLQCRARRLEARVDLGRGFDRPGTFGVEDLRHGPQGLTR
jgi:hypothetical protein